ncbi:hypothetical protein GCM10009111_17760 [Colwellia asteriadis]|uniref:Uncharacterized protein n=1 Tax=Colwellia asteriadis TaxID=517723 RepID=A0ABN1L6T7_9GAMM
MILKLQRLLFFAFYGRQLSINDPSEETVNILATMISEAAKCSRTITKLLNSLSSITGSGAAIRIVRSAAKLAKSDKNAFKMCNSITKYHYRAPLEISMLGKKKR